MGKSGCLFRLLQAFFLSCKLPYTSRKTLRSFRSQGVPSEQPQQQNETGEKSCELS
jgi:hypothetical protein